MISAHGVYVMFQYFLIYFNYVSQDTFQTFKAAGPVWPTLFPGNWKEKYYSLRSTM